MRGILEYLTVFRSRLGATNLVLSHTSDALLPDTVLVRRLQATLSQGHEIEPGTDHSVLAYLSEKGLVGPSVRKRSRYDFILWQETGAWRAADRRGNPLNRVRVYLPDVWMSDGRVPSTIGTPTPDNANEIIELTYQLGLLNRSKNLWTSAGAACAALRARSHPEEENPFILTQESAVLLRQILQYDGLTLREVSRLILERLPKRFRRDDVATSVFPEAVERSFEAYVSQSIGPSSDFSALRRYRDLIRKTTQKRESASSAPGVLEHRTSARLEWLVDLGLLSKRGEARNAFTYVNDGGLDDLVALLDQAGDWEKDIDRIALELSYRYGYGVRLPEIRDSKEALRVAYSILRRRIGPTPIREVVFVSCLLSRYSDTLARFNHLIDWASNDPKVTLSGGRYSRDPEMVYLDRGLIIDDV